MATNDNTSALLALPVELVGRIANSLEPESLLMLRLTCKALEHSTYDLFTKTFFEQRFCCIYYEPQWLLLKDIISSRLASRLREVTFTTDPLGYKLYRDLQLAPTESEQDIEMAQCVAIDSLWSSIGLRTQIPAWPSTAILHRVFRDLKRLAPKALIKFDNLGDWIPETNVEAPLLKADVLAAAVAAGLAIATLRLDLNDTHLLNSVSTHLEPELMASTRSLRSFRADQFRAQSDDYHPRFVTAVLKSASDLRELTVFTVPGHSIATAILQTANLSHLTTLRIRGASFTSEELVRGLSVCQSMLNVHLSHVGLSGGLGSWQSVFRALSSLPRLHQLCLTSMVELVAGPSNFRYLAYRGLSHGRTTTLGGRGIEHKGREQTAAGLYELLAAPLLGDDGYGDY